MYLIHRIIDNKIHYIWRSKSCFFCSKYLSLNIKQKFDFCTTVVGESLLLAVVGIKKFLVDKPLDFLIQLFQYQLVF